MLIFFSFPGSKNRFQSLFVFHTVEFYLNEIEKSTIEYIFFSFFRREKGAARLK